MDALNRHRHSVSQTFKSLNTLTAVKKELQLLAGCVACLYKVKMLC
jgi:hypothetical protein